MRSLLLILATCLSSLGCASYAAREPESSIRMLDAACDDLRRRNESLEKENSITKGDRGIRDAYIRKTAPGAPPTSAVDTSAADRLLNENGALPEAIARQMVYAAKLRIVVAAAEPTATEARRMAEEAGGYLQEQARDRVVLKVPATSFRAILDRLEGLGSVVDREVSAQDVTDQYVDVQARLRNARAVEARLKEMLAKANNVKEALEVEAELRRLGEEIERMLGQLKLLESHVAFSTITVELLGKTPVPEVLEPRVALPFQWLRSLDLESLIGKASRSALRIQG